MEGSVDDKRVKMVALHRHWCVADAVSHHLRRSTKTADAEDGLPHELADFAARESILHVLSVWY